MHQLRGTEWCSGGSMSRDAMRISTMIRDESSVAMRQRSRVWIGKPEIKI